MAAVAQRSASREDSDSEFPTPSARDDTGQSGSTKSEKSADASEESETPIITPLPPAAVDEPMSQSSIGEESDTLAVLSFSMEDSPPLELSPTLDSRTPTPLPPPASHDEDNAPQVSQPSPHAVSSAPFRRETLPPPSPNADDASFIIDDNVSVADVVVGSASADEREQAEPEPRAPPARVSLIADEPVATPSSSSKKPPRRHLRRRKISAISTAKPSDDSAASTIRTRAQKQKRQKRFLPAEIIDLSDDTPEPKGIQSSSSPDAGHDSAWKDAAPGSTGREATPSTDEESKCHQGSISSSSAIQKPPAVDADEKDYRKASKMEVEENEEDECKKARSEQPPSPVSSKRVRSAQRKASNSPAKKKRRRKCWDTEHLEEYESSSESEYEDSAPKSQSDESESANSHSSDDVENDATYSDEGASPMRRRSRRSKKKKKKRGRQETRVSARGTGTGVGSTRAKHQRNSSINEKPGDDKEFSTKRKRGHNFGKGIIAPLTTTNKNLIPLPPPFFTYDDFHRCPQDCRFSCYGWPAMRDHMEEKHKNAWRPHFCMQPEATRRKILKELERRERNLNPSCSSLPASNDATAVLSRNRRLFKDLSDEDSDGRISPSEFLPSITPKLKPSRLPSNIGSKSSSHKASEDNDESEEAVYEPQSTVIAMSDEVDESDPHQTSKGATDGTIESQEFLLDDDGEIIQRKESVEVDDADARRSEHEEHSSDEESSDDEMLSAVGRSSPISRQNSSPTSGLCNVNCFEFFTF